MTISLMWMPFCGLTKLVSSSAAVSSSVRRMFWALIFGWCARVSSRIDAISMAAISGIRST